MNAFAIVVALVTYAAWIFVGLWFMDSYGIGVGAAWLFSPICLAAGFLVAGFAVFGGKASG